MAKDKEPQDPRHVAREADLQHQQDQQDAMDAFYAQQAAEAREALRRQGVYETTGIRVVEGKP